MGEHLKRDLGHLKKLLLEIGAMVEEAVQKSLIAFEKRDTKLANEVIEGDNVIDDAEVELEEQCLKSLALHQPFAQDLRFITAVMKINNDLERMGDCAANIARRARSLAKGDPIEVPKGLSTMAEITQSMVRKAIDSFINKDPESARDVCKQDNEVDQYHKEVLNQLRAMMRKDSELVDEALDLFTTAKRIERIADLSTNIAEDVVYFIEGEIIRHSRDI